LLEVLTRGVETGAAVLKGLVNLWQAKTSQYLHGDHAMQAGDHARVEYPLWAGTDTIPPRHGSSPALFVYGRTQPETFLASGLFTGESTRKPPAPARLRFRLIFMGLRNQRLGKGGSRLESTESTQRNPGTAEATPGSHLRLGAQKALIQRQKTV
jgi:hypothetical protein